LIHRETPPPLGLEGTAGKSLYEALIGHADIKQKIVPTRFACLSMIPQTSTWPVLKLR
jgi:hypothetical protein